MIKRKIENNKIFLIFLSISLCYFIYAYRNLSASVLNGDGYVMFQYFVEIFLDFDMKKIGLIKYPSGTTLLQLPFLIVKLIFFNLIGVKNFGDDIAIQKAFGDAVFASALFYYSLSMVLIYKLLKRAYKIIPAVLSCICLTFGTMIPYYTLQNASYSHIYGMFIISAIFYVVDRYEKLDEIKIYHDLGLGALLGLSMLIRNTHIILVFVYLLYGVHNINSLKERIKCIFSRRVIAQLLGMVPVLFIQLLLWRLQAGYWIFYSYSGESFDYLTNPQIYNVLFSDAKGLFIYSPILFIGLISMIVFRNNREYYISSWIIIILTTYIISSWGCWWLGVCYGERMFCDVLIIFAFPLAALFENMNTTWKQKADGQGRVLNKIVIVLIYIVVALFIFINMRWLALASEGKLPVTMNYWSTLKSTFN